MGTPSKGKSKYTKCVWCSSLALRGFLGSSDNYSATGLCVFAINNKLGYVRQCYGTLLLSLLLLLLLLLSLQGNLFPSA